MNQTIVRSSGAITLLGGGKARAEDLTDSLTLAPSLVAVDGGADVALKMGKMPRAVVGDLDSLSAQARAAIPAERLHRIAEQDSTDFDKALRSVAAPLVLGVGFLGRRVDHQLANFNVLVRRASQPCILIGKRDVVFAAPPRIALNLMPDSRVSLFPLAQMRGRSRGLHWPVDDLAMAPDGVVGTSNRVAADHTGPVELEFDAPGMLIILPRLALDVVAKALGRGRPSVPAR